MRIWRYRTPKQFIASCIWNASEYTNIPLGKFAPKIFAYMIGYKNKKIK
jgi:hypothetical protein